MTIKLHHYGTRFRLRIGCKGDVIGRSDDYRSPSNDRRSLENGISQADRQPD
jgi:hypothetical protein